MNDIDKSLLGLIYTFGSILLGWMLNQFGQWFRGKQEDKKNLKLVLFNLLEIYYRLVRSDVEVLLTKASEKILSKVPQKDQNEETKNYVRSICSKFLEGHLKAELLKDISPLQENYQNAIKILATVDPFTAYRLSGKTNVLQIFDSVQVALDQMKASYPTENTEFENGSKAVIHAIKPNIMHFTQNDLENDIRTVAFKVSPLAWYRAIKTIKQIKINSNKQIDKTVDDLLETLTPFFASND